MLSTRESITALGLIAVTCTLLTGCAQMAEKRTITAFTEGLEAANLQKLQSTTSPVFRQNVLRTPEAAEDLKILRIPTGDVDVVEVEEVSGVEKKVKVEIGERKRRILYKLVKTDEESPWVVDDVYMSQKKNGKVVTKSVSEQMNLLQAAREYLAIWDSGDRATILRSVDPELRSQLEELPPSYLAELSRRISGADGRATPFRPDADINRDRAVVAIPRSEGRVVMSMKQAEGAWQVTDIAIESRTEGKHISSLKKHVGVVHSAVSFLDAFSRNDKKELSRVATDEFFETSLAPSALESVKLPSAHVSAANYEIKTVGDRSNVVIEDGNEVVHLNLVKGAAIADTRKGEFLVNGVVVHDVATQQEKELGALLTANSIVRIFSEALLQRRLDEVRQIASGDFNDHVWQRMSSRVARVIPMDGLENTVPKIVSTDFRGPLTEVTVIQGSQPLTYVVRNENNKLTIDDILLEDPNGQSESLKGRLSALTVVYEFAMNLHDENMRGIRSLASSDFNRRIWAQTDSVPNIDQELVKRLTAPLAKLEDHGGDAVVILGTQQYGSRIDLRKQGGKLVVNDAVVVDERRGAPISMKQAMRMHLASHGRNSSGIRQVSGTLSEKSQYRSPQKTSVRQSHYYEVHDHGSRQPRVHSSAAPSQPRSFTPHRQPNPVPTESLTDPIPLGF